ncbi:HAD family hydrolase [Mycolicibacterium thermoresistibile]|jgi:HAD superfamily hydrolase (TIGR01490 family)|uniref:Phosphoserine phosphatase SerB n=2 Tax=Mycolicibacterium thermoresistibile TaxID=1797 RepID=G7CM43_MYCT3|nr:HAD-IB family hydrolase [Mycolicibacterium thermoresistibile]EHI10996.1 phosphoserine phosphatase SerB [Mycolicibacterium thermoresistibile ATCC 19527]GAT13322.1 HAD-superfamily subfamily IB hydrolase, TIGR01490 [Mycolicibacterium thermoresistibile]SNW18503.1 phosphoserine phosphatase SerB [Mycolicibacterium thermoresistibile]
MANPMAASEASAPDPVAPVIAEVLAGPAGPTVGAFFDLDGTLVDGFTATAHAGHRIRNRQSSIGEVFGVIEASLRYRMGRMQFERLVVRAAGYLRGESLAELDELGEQLFIEQVASWIYPQMRELVRAHQQREHTVALCSSALTIHAEPVARFLGVDHVLCNHFTVDEHGRLTGDVVEPIIWGPQKAAAVQRFCAETGVALDRSHFYADGDEDTALMELVGHPRPVNPRPGLAAAAARNGWPVLRVAGSGRARRGLLRRRLRV